MITREVLVTGLVEDVDKGPFGFFSIVPAHGYAMHTTNSTYSLIRRLRPGQRVEFVKAEHSLLWGKIRWTETYVRVAKQPRGRAE